MHYGNFLLRTCYLSVSLYTFHALCLQRFLNRLREENALYLCPRGADDDLFWLYSTLYERPGGHSNTSQVITNDLMRDHKANAFDSGRVFMHWRTQHIVNFMVEYEENESAQGEAKTIKRVSFFESRKSTYVFFTCIVAGNIKIQNICH